MPEQVKNRTPGIAKAVSLLVIFTISFLSSVTSCSGEGVQNSETRVWFDVSKYFRASSSLRLGGDSGVRGFVFEEEFVAVYVRPSFEYLWNDAVRLYGGVGLFHAFQDGSSDITEIRPWGGFSLRWPAFRSIYLENYFRAEGRFFRTRKVEEIEQVLSSLRLRHRIGTVLPIADKKPAGKGFYIPLSFEVFFRAAGDIPARFIDQTRFWIGIGYQLGSGWKLETSYSWIQLRNDIREGFASTTHLIRIQIKG